MSGRLLFLLSLAGAANGFDNNRSGIVLGAGAGLTPAIHISEQVSWMSQGPRVSRDIYDRIKPGANLHLMLGWGLDHTNSLSLYCDLNAHLENKQRRLTLFTGLVWNHYFLSGKRGFFCAMGLGFYQYLPEREPAVNAAGPGMLLGGGLLLNPHWQIGLYASLGSSSAVQGYSDIDRDHWSLSVAVTAVAF